MGQTQIQVTVHVFGRAPRRSRGCGPGPGPGTVRLSPPRRSSSERAAQGPQRRQCPPGVPRLARVQRLTTSPPHPWSVCVMTPAPPHLLQLLAGPHSTPGCSSAPSEPSWLLATARPRTGVFLVSPARLALPAAPLQPPWRGIGLQHPAVTSPVPPAYAPLTNRASEHGGPQNSGVPFVPPPPVHLAVFSPLTSRGRALAVFEDCGARFQVLLTLPGLTAHHSMSSSLDVQ